jgi:ABC-type oligopeptide transport system ATPase subunit
MSDLLVVNNLVKDFKIKGKGNFRALEDVTFTVEEGKTFGLVGESGSGKSTVSRIVSRLTAPTSGQVLFNREDILAKKDKDLFAYRSQVQMIFQDPYASLNPRMTVEELICEPFEIHKLYTSAERSKRAIKLLDQVGLSRDSLNRKPIEFSGGQRQRILIARAIALNPKLLIADEPVSALDVLIQAQILNLLKDLQDELKLTYLFVSHDLSVVRFMSDFIGVMQNGRIVESGTAESVYSNPQTEYTKKLLKSIPSEDTALYKSKNV